MISVQNLVKKFGTQTVLHGVSFDLDRGEHCVIRGASGSGKSTLLYLLGALDNPSSGRIVVENCDLTALNDGDLAIYRNKTVGFVFQFHFLLPSLTAMENILLPSKLSKEKNVDITDHIYRLAKRLEVDHLLSKYPYQLSGGEQQRMSIIRSLSLSPKLLLCDEPTGNLDSYNSEKVINLLKELALEFHANLLLVTHDDFMASFFERRLVLKDGILV